MTPEQRDELRRLLERSHELPWTLIDEPRNKHYRRRIAGLDYEATCQHCVYIAGPGSYSDFVADLIVSRNSNDSTGMSNALLFVAAVNALPVLLDHIDQLEADKRTLEEALSDCRGDLGWAENDLEALEAERERERSNDP